MKTSPFKKLSAIIIAQIFFFAAVQAQIVYTDVNPDSVITNKPYNLDLNNDGIADFTIKDSVWYPVLTGLCRPAQDNYTTITPLNNNAVLSDANSYPYALQENAAIAPDLSSWSATTDQTLKLLEYECVFSRGLGGYNLVVSVSKGHWVNASDKYLGLKLIKGSNVYYGWIRLSSSFAIEAYAFNSIPNMPILAGQKTLFNWVAMDSMAPVKNLYCSGDSLTIKYSASGTFNASNVFKVQLSDSGGSFKNPVTIGSIKSSGEGGIINAKIPLKTLPGEYYSIRIVSSNPPVDSIYGMITNIVIGAAITVEQYEPTKFCKGNSTDLIAPQGYTYQWLKNGKKIKGETAYILEVGTSGNYSCIVYACGRDTSNTIAITVYPLPKAIVVASGPTTFCAPGSVTLSDTADAKNDTYSWNGISGATKSSYAADSTGNYSVQVTTVRGCFATSAGTIVIAAQPAGGSIGIGTGTTSFCVGDSTSLVADPYDGEDNSYTYQWKRNNQNINGATNDVYYVKTAGTYTCTMTNVCGSATSSGVTLTTTQCAEDSSKINETKTISPVAFTIAPNPLSNSTTISFSILQSQKVSVTIYDMSGRLIKTLADEQMQQGTHELIWNARKKNGNAVSNGIYFLRIQSEDFSETKKLSVIK